MPYKLAITVAGAVSLGTYEAGVLFEIIDAIAQHNGNPITPPDQRVFIDVLTGASAGGISTTLLTQKLLYEASELTGPYTNAMYRAWVQDLQFEPLMAFQPDEDPAQSILSSDYVNTVSVKYLMQRYSANPAPPPDPHPALDPVNTTIRLGLALSNLSGVDYQYAVRPSGTFTYTRFQDQLEKLVDQTSDNSVFWDEVRQAAVSCSAFPFAFRVHDLVRDQSDYPSPNVAFPGSSQIFTYTDGGTFQNQPIGLAKNLVDDLDPSHADADSRFYLFISPHAKVSDANRTFNEGNANFLTITQRLVNAVFGQSGFQDWIQAESINEKVRLFNTRAIQLKNGFEKDPALDPKPLQAAADELLPRLFANREVDEESLDAARIRLKGQFYLEYAELAGAGGPGPAAADTWIDSILLLETAADLGERDEMTIYGITADSSELAGAGLQAFLGFFKQAYRDHDYDVGRTKAQAFLDPKQNLSLGTRDNLPVLNYTPTPIRSIDHSLDGLALENVPQDLRKAMAQRLEDRAGDLLKETNLDLVLRGAIDEFVIKPQVKKFLML